MKAREEMTCLTPGASYHFALHPSKLEASVEFPKELLRRVSPEDAEIMNQRVHDVLEEVLAPFWAKRCL